MTGHAASHDAGQTPSSDTVGGTRTKSGKSGYSSWRLVAENLRTEIVSGRLSAGDRLPSEHELTERFSVSRHTVRRALASLAADGLVESQRGSGAFVTGDPVHVHRIGVRTRLSTSLGASRASSGRVLEASAESASPQLAARLGIEPGSRVTRVESLRTVDGTPLAMSTAWVDASRLPNLAEHLSRTSSMTAALRANGIEDYVRASTSVLARHATTTESASLDLDPGAIVLVTESVDAMLDGTPLLFVVTRFSAQRVHLDIEHPASGH